MNQFDTKAATWEDKPSRAERSLHRSRATPTLPSTVLLTIAISIAGDQPIAPIRAKRIITGQTTPATVLTAVSTTGAAPWSLRAR